MAFGLDSKKDAELLLDVILVLALFVREALFKRLTLPSETGFLDLVLIARGDDIFEVEVVVALAFLIFSRPLVFQFTAGVSSTGAFIFV